MADCDIQVSSCLGGFGLDDISVTVICFGYHGFSLAFRFGAYFVHFPEYVRQKLLFIIVHCRYFLRIVWVGSSLDRVNGKNLFPNSTASRHFQNIISRIAFDFIKAGVIFGIDFSNHGLHCHSVS